MIMLLDRDNASLAYRVHKMDDRDVIMKYLLFKEYK